jgi:hypothetical protein
MMKSIEETAKKNPFRVPDNYLEEANVRILSATIDKATVLNVVHRRRPHYLLIAASVSGFILLSYICYRLLIPIDKDLQLSEIVNGNNMEVLLNELDVSLIEENTIEPAFTEGASDIKSSDIIDYLSNENIDLSEIYERL